MFDENANPVVRTLVHFVGMWPMYGLECPFCKRFFAVIESFFEKEDWVCHCPMCCMEILVADFEPFPENKKEK